MMSLVYRKNNGKVSNRTLPAKLTFTLAATFQRIAAWENTDLVDLLCFLIGTMFSQVLGISGEETSMISSCVSLAKYRHHSKMKLSLSI